MEVFSIHHVPFVIQDHTLNSKCFLFVIVYFVILFSVNIQLLTDQCLHVPQHQLHLHLPPKSRRRRNELLPVLNDPGAHPVHTFQVNDVLNHFSNARVTSACGLFLNNDHLFIDKDHCPVLKLLWGHWHPASR